MKLNLGCGNDILENYTNVDISSTAPGIVKKDIFEFLRSIPNNSVSEVICFYLFEHLTYDEVDELLFQLSGRLETNGNIKILVPDFSLLCGSYKLNMHDASFLTRVLNYEVNSCNSESPHKSIWNSYLLRYYLTKENFYTISRLQNKVGKNNLGLFIEARRTKFAKYYPEGS